MRTTTPDKRYLAQRGRRWLLKKRLNDLEAAALGRHPGVLTVTLGTEDESEARAMRDEFMAALTAAVARLREARGEDAAPGFAAVMARLRDSGTP